MIHIHVQRQIHIPVYIFGMQFFHGKVKLISFQHRFRYTSENAGVVQTKEYPEMPWKTTKLLHPGVSVADVLSAGNWRGSRFRALSEFALRPTPITGKRLAACQEVVARYSGFLADGKRFYSPCTF